MSSLRRALLGLFAAGVVLAAIMVALTLSSDHEPDKVVTAILGPFVGLSFIGTGVFAWIRRPHNRFGALMTGVGFAWFVAGLTVSDDPTVHTLGVYLGPVYLVLVGHMLLAFPGGRVESTAGRTLLALAYVDVLLVLIPFFLLGGKIEGPGNQPDNAFALTDAPESAQVFESVAQLVIVGLLVWLIVLLWQKRRDATPPQRRAMAPVLWTGVAFMFTLGLTLAEDLLGSDINAQDLPSVLTTVTFAALPYAFLVGLLRTQVSRAGAVGELIERLSEDGGGASSLREALSEALGDRSLEIVYWSRQSERYVGSDGQPVALPGDGRGRTRAVTEIEREGAPVAALVHDVALLDEPGLVRAAGAAAALALENERLEAELKARVDELQVSRRKVIEVGMHERRALERNLHDGAQQRLVALSLQLGLARAKLREHPEVAERILDGAREELAAALEELRELARGIHPAVLTDRGLAAALEVLAGRAPVAVELEAVDDRLPMPVEAAAYFVVAESLTNVARYAGAQHAVVRVKRENGEAVVEIQDDGVGGADPSSGSGLRGLADRVAALDGKLEVRSPKGEGTLIRARIPCG